MIIFNPNSFSSIVVVASCQRMSHGVRAKEVAASTFWGWQMTVTTIAFGMSTQQLTHRTSHNSVAWWWQNRTRRGKNRRYEWVRLQSVCCDEEWSRTDSDFDTASTRTLDSQRLLQLSTVRCARECNLIERKAIFQANSSDRFNHHRTPSSLFVASNPSPNVLKTTFTNAAFPVSSPLSSSLTKIQI